MATPDQPQPEIVSDVHGEFIIYRTEDERTEVHLRLIDNNVWMTQSQIADLFGVTRANVSAHLKNIYEEGDLTRDRTVKSFLTVRSEGDRDIRRKMDHYNLDAIMAVGYRVRGPRGAQFRRWATEVLKEYLIKGFAMNDEKLKDPRGTDYFDELLERIRDIRSSEKRLYKQLRDIFRLAVDYDTIDEQTIQRFFQKMQNKLHYAVAGQTSGEIIATRCDPQANNLGLVTFPGKKVTKKDVTVAKNYLTQEELTELNLLVSQFLDFAESQARRRLVVHLMDWEAKADQFVEFNSYQALTDNGRISKGQADALAKDRYKIFDDRRRAAEDAELDAQDLERLMEIDRQILRDRKRLAPRTM